jgi:hypothetical protein
MRSQLLFPTPFIGPPHQCDCILDRSLHEYLPTEVSWRFTNTNCCAVAESPID